jgi:hypothetical protein
MIERIEVSVSKQCTVLFIVLQRLVVPTVDGKYELNADVTTELETLYCE